MRKIQGTKACWSGRYASGQRRCQICEIFIKWEGLWCPCCGYRLRTKPRNLKYKAKLRARVEADSKSEKALADTPIADTPIADTPTPKKSAAKKSAAKKSAAKKSAAKKSIPIKA